MADLTIADLDQAEAQLAEAKRLRALQVIEPQEYVTLKREAVAVRRVWREQEEAADRRTGRVGGDAFKTGG